MKMNIKRSLFHRRNKAFIVTSVTFYKTIQGGTQNIVNIKAKYLNDKDETFTWKMFLTLVCEQLLPLYKSSHLINM